MGFFQRGIVHGFDIKLEIFPSYYFWQNQKENVFDNILERKKAFLYYKKQKVKKSKNWHFSKEVNTLWFWSKIWKFSIFFIIGKISQQNVFDNILERKKVFLHSKIRKSKKLKNWDFSKGVSPWFRSKIEIFPCFYYFLSKSDRKACLKTF